MAKFTNSKSLYYDDVILLAQPGKVNSRQTIPIEGNRIVVSAMTSIVGPDFIKAVAILPANLQPTLHIPRDIYAESNLRLCKELGLKHVFVGVGLNTPNLVKLAGELGFKTLFIDVANGYLPALKLKARELGDQGFKIIAGSVHTNTGAQDLYDAGADIIRSGIGPGSVCITKDSTGYTRGNISEILAIASGRHDKNYETGEVDQRPYGILADGGLRSPSDCIKAFLSGAHYVMTGRMFVDAAEARLRIDGSNIYYGMASELGKKAMGKVVENVEGKLDELPRDNVQPLQTILETIWAGIRSGVSYSGYATLTDAIGNGVFEIKHSSRK